MSSEQLFSVPPFEGLDVASARLLNDECYGLRVRCKVDGDQFEGTFVGVAFGPGSELFYLGPCSHGDVIIELEKGERHTSYTLFEEFEFLPEEAET